MSKAISALAKVGDEIYVQADEGYLKFTTLNMSKTVCSQCSFMKSFFSSYDVAKGNFSEEDGTITCKLFMKSILPLFKGNLEKKVNKLGYNKLIFHLYFFSVRIPQDWVWKRKWLYSIENEI